MAGGWGGARTGVLWTQPPMPSSLSKDHLFTYLFRKSENVSRTIPCTWLLIGSPMGCVAFMLSSSSCQSKQVGSQGDPGNCHTASGPQETVSALNVTDTFLAGRAGRAGMHRPPQHLCHSAAGTEQTPPTRPSLRLPHPPSCQASLPGTLHHVPPFTTTTHAGGLSSSWAEHPLPQ